MTEASECKPTALEFTRMGTWHEATTCGRYSVAAAKNGEKYTFCAYRAVPGSEALLLGCFTSVEQARDCCRQDAAKP